MRAIRLFLFLALACLVAAGCTPRDPDVIVVGTDASFKPMEFMNSRSGEIEGFDIDLLHAIGKEAGLVFSVRGVSFDSLIPGLQTGEYGLVISSMTITPERSKRVKFSDPYYTSGLVIAVRKDDNSIASFADLKGLKIGVQRGTTGSMKAHEIEGATVQEYETIDLAFNVLAGMNVDAVINDQMPTLEVVTTHSDAYKIVGELISSEQYGIAMPIENTQLHSKINAALKAVRENGEYARIYKKWFGKDPN